MLEVSTAIYLSLMGSAMYHLIPTGCMRLRMMFVAFLSFTIVFAYYPLAALVGFAAGVFSWCIALMSARIALVAKYGPFSLIAILAVFSYEDIVVATNPYDKTLVQFGMSFYILRLYLTLRTAASRQQTVSLAEFLAIALFFPIFSAGPICGQEAFSGSSAPKRPHLQNYLKGFLHIGMGLFALHGILAVGDTS